MTEAYTVTCEVCHQELMLTVGQKWMHTDAHDPTPVFRYVDPPSLNCLECRLPFGHTGDHKL